jgi:hypothetical protein
MDSSQDSQSWTGTFRRLIHPFLSSNNDMIPVEKEQINDGSSNSEMSEPSDETDVNIETDMNTEPVQNQHQHRLPAQPWWNNVVRRLATLPSTPPTTPRPPTTTVERQSNSMADSSRVRYVDATNTRLGIPICCVHCLYLSCATMFSTILDTLFPVGSNLSDSSLGDGLVSHRLQQRWNIAVSGSRIFAIFVTPKSHNKP